MQPPPTIKSTTKWLEGYEGTEIMNATPTQNRRTPKDILGAFGDSIQNKLATRANAKAIKEEKKRAELTDFKDYLLALCFKKIDRAGEDDAVSLEENGCLRPIKLYQRTNHTLDKLFPSHDEKSNLVEAMNETLAEHDWKVRIETGKNGLYQYGWVWDRHIAACDTLVLSPLHNDGDGEPLTEEKKKNRYPAYAEARNLEVITFQCPDFMKRIQECTAYGVKMETIVRLQLGLNEIPADDEAALRQWINEVRMMRRGGKF